MSRMWVRSEVLDWLAAWSKESPIACFRAVSRAATEQRANFERCLRDRRWPDYVSEEDYRTCVVLLEEAVPAARWRAEQWERDYDARIEADRKAQDEAMKLAGERFPLSDSLTYRI